MKEQNKKRSTIILLVALAVIAVFVVVIVVKFLAPGKSANPEDFVGQWTDHEHNEASLDIWDTDENLFVGMSSWQQDFNHAVFLDFTAELIPSGLRIIECKRTDMSYDGEGAGEETVVYENATGMIRRAEGDTLMITVDGDDETKDFRFTLEGAY